MSLKNLNSQILPNLRADRGGLSLPINTPRGLCPENQQMSPQDLSPSSLLAIRPITKVSCSIPSQEYALPCKRRKRPYTKESARPTDMDQQEPGEQVWDLTGEVLGQGGWSARLDEGRFSNLGLFFQDMDLTLWKNPRRWSKLVLKVTQT